MFQTIKNVFIYAVLASLVLASIIFSGKATADTIQKEEPALLSLGLGYYDFNRKKETGTELRAEYRSGNDALFFKPFLAVSVTNTSQGFVGAGILLDFHLGRKFVMTPSFAPHYYWGGNTKLDLGHSIEFRSQMEFSYRFKNESRLGMAVSHYSNASLGTTNPGTETGTIYFSFPLD